MASRNDVVKVSFIINSSKRRAGEIVQEIQRVFKDEDYEIVPTNHSGHAIELARQASAKCRTVVAVGGDGTANECVNGLMHSEFRQMAILPLGTGNDFVRTFPQAGSVQQLLLALQQNRYQSIDVMRLSSGEGQEYALNIADAGIGAVAVGHLAHAPSWLGPRLKYTWAIVKTLITARNEHLICRMAHETWEGKAKLIAAANGKCFGTGLFIAPGALVHDGLLDITVIGDISLFTYLRKSSSLRRGDRIDHPEVCYFRTPRVELEGPVRMEKDGELSFALPVCIEVDPGAIMMLEV